MILGVRVSVSTCELDLHLRWCNEEAAGPLNVQMVQNSFQVRLPGCSLGWQVWPLWHLLARQNRSQKAHLARRSTSNHLPRWPPGLHSSFTPLIQDVLFLKISSDSIKEVLSYSLPDPADRAVMKYKTPSGASCYRNSNIFPVTKTCWFTDYIFGGWVKLPWAKILVLISDVSIAIKTSC